MRISARTAAADGCRPPRDPQVLEDFAATGWAGAGGAPGPPSHGRGGSSSVRSPEGELALGAFERVRCTENPRQQRISRQASLGLPCG